MAVLEMVSSTAEKIGTTAVEVAKKGAELVADAVEKTAETVGEAAEKGAETGKSALEGTKEGIRQKSLEGTSFAKSKLSEVRGMTPEQLRFRVEDIRNQMKNGISLEGGGKSGNLEGLSNLEKKKIKLETSWSNENIAAIDSMLEYEIYKKARLQEAEINGRKCLIREDIDWEQKDGMERTNRERVQQGLSPCNKDGKVIELHHIGQHADSPLAELTQEEHRGKENYHILHHKSGESEIDRIAFGGERAEHWENRAKEGSGS